MSDEPTTSDKQTKTEDNNQSESQKSLPPPKRSLGTTDLLHINAETEEEKTSKEPEKQ